MRRDLLIFAAALLALALSAGIAAATAATAAFSLRGYADATRSDALPDWEPKFGVNADLRLYEGDELAQTLDLIEEAGANWVRQTVPWASVEAESGTFDWQDWDRVIEPFAARPNLRLIAVLDDAPAWAIDAAAPDQASAPPAEPGTFARFARVFAERYGGIVDFYQIWDEPNLESGWGGFEPRPVEYLALLAAAYPAIHGADARAQVVAAGLAPTTESGPHNLSDALFLDQLLDLGGARYMDAAAGKPFGFERPPDDRTVSPDVLNFSRIILLRETLVEHGLDTMPLWASAWGWNSLPGDWVGEPSIWGAVNSDQQATYTIGALDRAEREWPWLTGMALYTWQPDAPDSDPQWGFAVRNAAGEATPLFNALAARPSPEAAGNGLYAPDNPYAAYSGAWRFGPLGADIGDRQDSQALFRFEGRDVALQLRQDDFVAYLFVEVDGEPANALPVDGGGNSYVILTSDTRQPTIGLTTVATGLAPGEHVLRIIADRGWERWALAGYAVSSGNLADPFAQTIAIALGTSVVALGATLVSGWRLDWGAFGQLTGRIWRGLGVAGQYVLSAVAALALLMGMLLSFGGLVPDLLRREPAALGLAAGAALVVYLSPPLLLAAAGALALFIIFYHRPDIGLMLTVFFTPFYLFPVELYRFAFPMAELLLLLLVAAWLLRRFVEWARGRQVASSEFPGRGITGVLAQATWLDALVTAYLVLGGLALIWSAERGPASTEVRVLFIEPALFYLILRATARQSGLLLRLADTLMAAGLTVAVIGLLQFVAGASVVVAEGGSLRLASVYGSPNNAALFLERALPFALVMTLIPFDRRRRLFGGLAALTMTGALALTLSAGALFLGVPAAVALVLVLQYGKRGFLALAALAVLLGGALAVALQSERFARLADLSSGTSFFRVRVWQSAVQMIADHPVTGIGLDQFLYQYRGQYIAPDAWQEPDLSHPHNFVLDFWLRLGLLGALLVLAVQAAFWVRSFRIWRHANRAVSVRRALIIGAMGSMIGLTVHGMVDNSVFVNDLAIVFMLLLAIPASLPIEPKDTEEAPVPPPDTL
ncbi:MAG: O-antigen ligase family protein [Anaerolineae bacterium]|nr:O-antigen ligase family protein [Anaerolineae bacterium]